jgi:hypothetical protein
VVLLDEYQDTSQAQVELLRSLFRAGHPVTAVGDPCPVHLRLAWRQRRHAGPFAIVFARASGAAADHRRSL